MNGPYEDYREATDRLPFTKDFFDSIKATIYDEDADIDDRVKAWIKFRAWGKQRLYCIRDNGTPAHQKDCAADLNLNKSTVSKSVTRLTSRGYLRPMEGKLLWPELSPQITPLSEVSDAETFQPFLDLYKVSNAETFDAWQAAKAAKKVADAAEKKLRLVVYAAYKELMAAQQSGRASLLTETTEDLKTDEQTHERQFVVSSPEKIPEPETLSSSEPPASPPPKSPPPETENQTVRPFVVSPPTLKELVRVELARFVLPTKLNPDMLDQIMAHIPDEGVFEQFRKAIKDTGPDSIDRWTYFRKVARLCDENREMYAIAKSAHTGARETGETQHTGRSKATEGAMALAARRAAQGFPIC